MRHAWDVEPFVAEIEGLRERRDSLQRRVRELEQSRAMWRARARALYPDARAHRRWLARLARENRQRRGEP